MSVYRHSASSKAKVKTTAPGSSSASPSDVAADVTSSPTTASRSSTRTKFTHAATFVATASEKDAAVVNAGLAPGGLLAAALGLVALL